MLLRHHVLPTTPHCSVFTHPWSCNSRTPVMASWRTRGSDQTVTSGPSHSGTAGNPWGCYPCLCSACPNQTQSGSACRLSASRSRGWSCMSPRWSSLRPSWGCPAWHVHVRWRLEGTAAAARWVGCASSLEAPSPGDRKKHHISF